MKSLAAFAVMGIASTQAEFVQPVEDLFEPFVGDWYWSEAWYADAEELWGTGFKGGADINAGMKFPWYSDNEYMANYLKAYAKAYGKFKWWFKLAIIKVGI